MSECLHLMCMCLLMSTLCFCFFFYAHLTDCERSLRINCELCQVDAKLYNMNTSARTKKNKCIRLHDESRLSKTMGSNHIK